MLTLQANCVLKDKEQLYLTSSKSAIIFKMDVASTKIEQLEFVPEKSKYKNALFGNILNWGEWLVLVPWNAENIWLVDKKFANWKKIELENKNVNMKFCASAISSDRLYLFKHLYPKSLCVNLFDNTVEEINGLESDFFRSALQQENVVYLPSASRNILYIYDLQNKKITKKELGGLVGGNEYISKCGDKLILVPRQGNELVEMKNGNIVSKIKLAVNKWVRDAFLFNGKVYLPSANERESLIYVNGNLESWNINYIVCSKALDERTHALLDEYGKLYLFFQDDCTSRKIELEIQEDIYHDLISVKDIFSDRELNYESSLKSFNDFVKAVSE